MTKKIWKCIIFMSLLFWLAGCLDTRSTPARSTDSVSNSMSKPVLLDEELTAVSNEDSESTDQSEILSGDQFQQPADFRVHTFELNYDKASHAIVYHINYQLGADATRFIRNGSHRYYLGLDVAEKWRPYFHITKPAQQEGAQLNGDVTNIYSVDIRIPLQPQVTDQVIEQIVNDPRQYVLSVYEEPAFRARVIVNVYEWMKINN